MKTKNLAALILAVALVFGAAVYSGAFGGAKAESVACNPNATTEANNVLNYLNSLSYSKSFLSGLFDFDVTANTYEDTPNYDRVHKTFGVPAAVYSGSYNYNSYSKTYSFEHANISAKRHYDEGSIILMHPGSEFSNNTMELAAEYGIPTQENIPLHYDSTNPDRIPEIYELYRDILKQWADCLEDLQNRGVDCILFRPFVELNGPWLYNAYCTSDEALTSMRNVWRQMYDYLYVERKLNSVLLVFAPSVISGDTSTMSLYYPGNEYVDIIAPTMYTATRGANTPIDFPDYDWVLSTGKPLGFSELSVRSGSSIQAQNFDGGGDWMLMHEALTKYFPATTFINAYGTYYSFLPNEYAIGKMGNENGEMLLHSPFVKNRPDLPDFKSGTIPAAGAVRLYSKSKYEGSLSGFAVGSYSESELREKGINPAEIQSFELVPNYSVTFYSQDNCQGTAWKYISNVLDISGSPAYKKIRSIKVEHIGVLENIALKKSSYANDEESQIYKINDGMLSRWETEISPSWAVIDLEGAYTISKWVVKNAGAASDSDIYNSVDYRLEYSTDGEKWITVDAVKGNRENVTSRSFPQVTARYVRLTVTKPNIALLEEEINSTAISELEIYGISAE